MLLLSLIPRIIDIFFKILILFLFIRVILSWLPMAQGNPIVRFLTNVTDPVLTPVARRMPRMSAGMFDLGYMVAFIFTFWLIATLDFLIVAALPQAWLS